MHMAQMQWNNLVNPRGIGSHKKMPWSDDCNVLAAVAATSFSFTGVGYIPCALPITPIGVGIFPQGINIQPAGLYIQPTGALPA